MLNLLSTVTFALLAFGYLSIHIYVSPIFMFVTVLVFLALRDISSALANPFGADDVDLPIQYLVYSVRRQATLLAGVAGTALPMVPDVSEAEAQYNALHEAAQQLGQSLHVDSFKWPTHMNIKHA